MATALRRRALVRGISPEGTVPASQANHVMSLEAIKILIADDEPSVLEFVDRVLREAGYTTALAADGSQALDIAEQLGSFDLLLTDLMMPQMTGDELARQLRQKDPALKVLYFTGYSAHLFRKKKVLWEDEAFLEKPFSLAGLREAVSLLLYGISSLPDNHNG